MKKAKQLTQLARVMSLTMATLGTFMFLVVVLSWSFGPGARFTRTSIQPDGTVAVEQTETMFGAINSTELLILGGAFFMILFGIITFFAVKRAEETV